MWYEGDTPTVRGAVIWFDGVLTALGRADMLCGEPRVLLPVWMNMAAIRQFHFREHWRELRRGRPGSRFQTRYERARRERASRGAAWRIGMIVAAVLCLAIAVVLTVIPGPAFVFFILGGALLATESRSVARLLDRTEVMVRKLANWAIAWWRRSPIWAQVVLVFLLIASGAGTGFLAYRMIRG